MLERSGPGLLCLALGGFLFLASCSSKETDEYPLQENPLAGCSLCHVDIEDEFVGNTHFKQNVGCKSCHGPSEGHLADENNEVKPDQLFAREDVDRLCGECHECGRPDASPRVCTDCHGPHDS